MDNKILNAVKDRLHPLLYPDFVSLEGGHWLLREKRYAVAAFDWGRGQDGGTNLSVMRKTVRKATGAIWFVRELGVQLLVFGAESDWAEHVDVLKADKVALKAVIVQAVHLIDPISGQYHLDRSQWGPVQFGRVEPVSTVIRSVLEGLS
jgi:hypothetical protein